MTARGIRATDKRAAKLFALLTTCANEGRAVPSNAELANFLELEQTTSAIEALKRLERRGLVTVQRFNNSRVVTITSTGQSTAGPSVPGRWVRDNHAVRPDQQPQSHDAFAVVPQPQAQRVNREPCTFCGTRTDIGCACSRKRAARPFLFVPNHLHAAEVVQP